MASNCFHYVLNLRRTPLKTNYVLIRKSCKTIKHYFINLPYLFLMRNWLARVFLKWMVISASLSFFYLNSVKMVQMVKIKIFFFLFRLACKCVQIILLYWITLCDSTLKVLCGLSKKQFYEIDIYLWCIKPDIFKCKGQ